MSLELWMALFPALFMLHELEELVGFRRFLSGRRSLLHCRYPRLAAVMERVDLFRWSTATFAVGVTHEYILLLAAVVPSLWLHAYHWWYVALAGYTLHLLAHVAQWIALGCYIPCILTTLLTLPYCGAMIWAFAASSLLTPTGMLLWALVGIALASLSFPSAYMLMRWHHRRRFV